MASLDLTPDEVIEARLMVDVRGSAIVLASRVFTSGLSVGAATDWAWTLARQGRTDIVGTTGDFALFLMGLSTAENTHFRRAVLYRTAGLVASRYRELLEEGGVGIDETYGKAQESVPFLFAQAESELSRFRESAPSGAYERQKLTLFAITEGC